MLDLTLSILIQGLQVAVNVVAVLAAGWHVVLCCWLLLGLVYLLGNEKKSGWAWRVMDNGAFVTLIRRGGTK